MLDGLGSESEIEGHKAGYFLDESFVFMLSPEVLTLPRLGKGTYMHPHTCLSLL